MPDSEGYSYNKFNTGKQNPVLGNPFKGPSSQKTLSVPNTRSSSIPASDGLNAGMSKNRFPGINRPSHQNAYRTISSPALGKADGWNGRGDNKKRNVSSKVYSMNHVSTARILKGNVNANEGAYLKRGGDRQV